MLLNTYTEYFGWNKEVSAALKDFIAFNYFKAIDRWIQISFYYLMEKNNWKYFQPISKKIIFFLKLFFGDNEKYMHKNNFSVETY